MTAAEKEIMDLIEYDNEITCNEMSHKLSKDISTIKRTIQKLKEKGFLIRQDPIKTALGKF